MERSLEEVSDNDSSITSDRGDVSAIENIVVEEKRRPLAMSSWNQWKKFDPAIQAFSEYVEELEQLFLIDEVEEVKKKPILMLKLDGSVREYVNLYFKDNSRTTYASIKKVLMEKYDGSRVRNEYRLKARDHRIVLEDLYNSILAYVDYVKKGSVVKDPEEVRCTVKEKLIEKLIFKPMLSQRVNDRFDYYDGYEELALDIDTYWKGFQKSNRRQDHRRSLNRSFSPKEPNHKAKVRCYLCKNMGHYASECKNRAGNQLSIEKDRDKDGVNVGMHLPDKEPSTCNNNTNDELIVVPLSIENKEVLALLDSGCVTNLISSNKFAEICLANDKEIRLHPYDKTLVGAFGQNVKAEGWCEVQIGYNDEKVTSTIVVVRSLKNYDMLMGIGLIKKLNLMNISCLDSLKKKVPDEIVVGNVGTTCVSNIEMIKRIKVSFDKVDEVISQGPTDIGRFVDTVPRIVWKKDVVRKFYPYRYPNHLWNIGENLLEDMLRSDILEVGSARYIHNVIIVRKHGDHDSGVDMNKLYRAVVDLRPTNAMVERVDFGSIQIEDFILLKENYNYFCSIDLTQCFHQFELSEGDREYFGVSFPNMPTMRYKRLPMGFANSPSILRQLLEKRVPPNIVKFYYDDGFKGTSGSLEDHVKSVELILRHLHKANLKINLDKSILCAESLEVLGHSISRMGTSPSERAVKIMKSYKKPVSVESIRKFLGFISYYRKYIPGLSSLLKPILYLLKKDVKFEWSDEANVNFERIRQILIEKPLLGIERSDLPLLVYTDASTYAFGGVLMQKQDGRKVPLLYWSSGRKYYKRVRSACFLEMQSVIMFYRSNKHRLLGKNEIVWYVDNSPAVAILRKGYTDNEQFLAWIMELPIQIQFHHIEGSRNVVADYLSREIDVVKLEQNDVIDVCFVDEEVPIVKRGRGRPRKKVPVVEENLKFSSEEGKESKKVGKKRGRKRKVEKFTSSNDDVDETHWKEYGMFSLNDFKELNESDYEFVKVNKLKLINDFYYKDSKDVKDWKLLYIPMNKQDEVIKYVHEHPAITAHGGIEQTLMRLKKVCIFKEMKEKVEHIVKNCEICILRKHPAHLAIKPRLHSWKIPEGVWKRVHCDILGPLGLTSSGNKYIVTMVCGLSKFVILSALQHITAEDIGNLLVEKVFPSFGVFDLLVTDCGLPFKNELMEKLSAKYGFQMHFTSANTHNSNGQVERIHRIINEKLVLNNKVSEWDLYLPELQRILNLNIHGVTGFSPFFLMFGRSDDKVGDLSVLMNSKLCKDDILRLLLNINQLDLMESARNIGRRNIYNERAFERRGVPNNKQVNIGDKVMMKTYYDKHKKAYMGPFEIIDIKEENVVIVKSLVDKLMMPFKVHVSQLKFCETQNLREEE
uniref:RNA-directed DNA polymerase n=1 Tax=Strongyloides stercoralis TaxID=6248 RepID=A0AAF5DFL6_STRER